MAIKYEEVDGTLRYSYEEKDSRVDIFYSVSGIVPSALLGKGTRTVRAYVQKAVQEKIGDEKKKKAAWVKFLQDLSVAISTEHRGVLLTGRIIHADHSNIVVYLDEPKGYQGQSSMHFGFASAITGHHVFDSSQNPPQLSRWAIEGGQRVLTWIYDEKKHKRDYGKLTELAKSLNRRFP